MKKQKHHAMKKDKEGFTPEKFKEFKRVYKKAVEEGKESFWFDNQECLVSYAKYLIEWQKSFKT